MARWPWLLPPAAAAAAILYHRLRGASLHGAPGGSQPILGPAARVYDGFAGLVVEPFLARVAPELAALAPSGRALDVGCGPGHLAVRLAREAPGLEVVGLDLSPDMAALGRRRAERSGLAGRVRFEVGDATALPFPDGSFDLVVSSFSMHHWGDPDRGLAEVRRVLKPGGRACIYDMAGWLLRALRHGPPFPPPSAARLPDRVSLETAWGLGSTPLVQRLCVTRAAEVGRGTLEHESPRNEIERRETVE